MVQCFLLAGGLCGLLAWSGVPHGLHVQAKIVGERWRIEAFFSDDTPAENAKVQILQDQALLKDGTTDEHGLWYTEIPQPGCYRIVVDAGAGHRAEIAFELAVETDEATAGLSREEWRHRQWLGIPLGLGLILLLILLGKRLSRR
jgi:hypothetical protein